MSIQYKFFTISVKHISEAEADFNKFLRSVRLITLHREFVPSGENSFWAIAAEYLSEGSQQNIAENTSAARSRVDYKEVLSPEDFAIFAKLRDWRKEAAGQDAAPVYTIFTNEQLAKIVQKRITSKSGLQEIEGVGEARIKKYGDSVIKIVAEEIKSAATENSKSQEQKPDEPSEQKPNKSQEPKNETEGKPLLFDSGPGKSPSGVPQSRQR